MPTPKRPTGLEQAVIGFLTGVNAVYPQAQQKQEEDRIKKAEEEAKQKAERVKLNKEIFEFAEKYGQSAARNVYGTEDVDTLFPAGYISTKDAEEEIELAEYRAEEKAGMRVPQPTEMEVKKRKAEAKERVLGQLQPESKRKYTQAIRNYFGLKAKKMKWDATTARGEAEKFVDVDDPVAKAIAEGIFQTFSVPVGEFTEQDQVNMDWWRNEAERIGGVVLERPAVTETSMDVETIVPGTKVRVGEFVVETIDSTNVEQ